MKRKFKLGLFTILLLGTLGVLLAVRSRPALSAADPQFPALTEQPAPAVVRTPIPANGVGRHNDIINDESLGGRGLHLVLDGQNDPHLLAHSFTAPKGVVYAAWDGVRWWSEQVDAIDPQGETALVLDGQERPHLAYINDTPGEVKYAMWDGSAWQKEVVADISGDLVPWDVSLVLDGQERPYLAYFSADKELFLAHRDGGVWTPHLLDTFEALSGRGSLSTLALDGSDQAHLVYARSLVSPLGHELYYGVWDGAAWQQQQLVTDTFRFDTVEMVLDGNGRPHLIYSTAQDLYYMMWNGTTWQQDLIGTPGDPLDASLMLDSQDQPHVVVTVGGTGNEVLHFFHDGQSWQSEQLDNAEYLDLYLGAAIDPSDRLHVVYEASRTSNTFSGDVHYLHDGPYWRTVPVAAAAYPDLALDFDRPFLSYQDQFDGRIEVAQRQPGQWQEQPIAPASLPGADSSIMHIDTPNNPETILLSFYDSDNAQLSYVEVQNEMVRTVQSVDQGTDVGQYNVMMHDDAWPYIAYWDGSGYQLKMAVRWQGGWQIYPHTSSPAVFVDHMDAARTGNSPVYVSYHDSSNGDLRLATFSLAAGAFTDDVLVDGSTGLPHALEIDTATGSPVLAYYDQSNQAIKLARWEDNIWQIGTVVTGTGSVNSLDLQLELGQAAEPRIAYSTIGSTALYFAWPNQGQWQVETIVAPGGAIFLSDVTLEVGERPFITYVDGQFGLQMAVRAAPIDYRTAVPYVPTSPGTDIDDEDTDTVDWCIPDLLSSAPDAGLLGLTALPGGDFGVFDRMTDLFYATPGGQHYVDSYLLHAPEMGRIALSDADLLWDSYRTLQGFMPGLEALVLGTGSEITVTQNMADDAYDVWTRLASAATPALAQLINQELAASNNLQDFVGLTFDEWATNIGVAPPAGNKLYLPAVVHP